MANEVASISGEKCGKFAALKGHLEILKWVLRKDVKNLDNEAYLSVLAASGGHLEIVEWFYFYNSMFDSDVLDAASRTWTHKYS